MSTATRTPVAKPGQAPETPDNTPAWAIVTLREVMVKMRDRTYLLSTLVTLLLIVGGVLFNAYMSSRGSDHTVAVADSAAAEIITAADAAGQEDGGNTSFEAVTADSPEAALQLVNNEEADAALIQGDDGSWTLTGKAEIGSGIRGPVSEALTSYVISANAAAAGTTAAELTAGSELEEALLEGDAEQAGIAAAVGFAFSFLFYMATIIFGLAIATSVLEEKQNRVVEILATAIPIRQLLYGKVIGNTVLAVVQLALYGGAALLALNLTGTADMVGSIIPVSGWFLVFFLVGFLILAAGWAMLGAMASRSEDLNSSSTPVMAIIFAALFAGMFAKGQLLVVASFVPVISSVAMPVRMLGSEVPLWQTFASLAIALAAAYALLGFGAKIYRRAVLQSGGSLTLRKAMKLEQ
ncbi:MULTISPECIES: ABC transporter permease [unclassified Arthrobacter]|uniref:ABC transporter permease n=1 Tax=unclassified Arthrobacter TaxID=235627 RepID=UPI001D13941E|nr:MULTISPECIES: ABC transporter permease [unclassified Arthrobacter]MCC3289934.1 ABC transporter permease [Arthrobacter sp. zg-Y1110]MCC3300554.1 ABC transporter permease [Arthrobacter sp. zg-Y895]UWX84659.1 ABC transporter permease [Arthrobacter sp. zg-Y1110]